MRFRLHIPALALLAGAGVAAAPTGHIAFTRNNVGIVVPAGGGPEKRLPSNPLGDIALSPKDGTAILLAGYREAEEPYRAFVCRPPYRTTKALPAVLSGVYGALWSGDGRRAFFNTEAKDGATMYEPASGRTRHVPAYPASVSRDGNVMAYSTEKDVRVRWLATGRERVLFSIGRPDPLFAAIRTARYRAKLKEMQEGIDPALFNNTRNWVLGDPAISPDGKTVYFAANAGMGQGAQGNTTFCFFAADTATGKLSALAKAGTFFGRSPEPCAVSPDGQRLLFASSAHSSAAENPFGLWVVDLPTQAVRELLGAPGGKTNLMSGACWSPDSRYVAASVVYYDANYVWKHPNWEVADNMFRLMIYDARTGRKLSERRGGNAPSWGK